MTAIRHATAALVWAVLVFTLLLPGVLGSIASIGAVVAALLLVPAWFAAGQWRQWRTEPAVAIFVAVFVLLAAMFAITADEPADVLFAANFLGLPLAAVVLAMAPSLGAGEVAIRRFATICLLGAAAAAAVAGYDVLGRGLERAEGFVMGSNMLARVALVLGFGALAGAFAGPSRWRFVYWLGPALALAAVFLTGSRGALVGLVPVAIALVVVMIRSRDRRMLLVAGAVLALVAVIAAIDLMSGGGVLVGRFASIAGQVVEVLATGGTEEASTARRLTMYGAGWQAFLANPWLGYGWADLAPAASAYMDMLDYGGGADPWFQFHNDALNFAVAAGVPGVVCYLALLAAPVAGALASQRDRWRTLRIAALAILSATWAVFGLTDIAFGYDLPTTLYAFVTAIVLGTWRETSPIARTRPSA